jgi:hypothetical protein
MMMTNTTYTQNMTTPVCFDVEAKIAELLEARGAAKQTAKLLEEQKLSIIYCTRLEILQCLTDLDDVVFQWCSSPEEMRANQPFGMDLFYKDSLPIRVQSPQVLTYFNCGGWVVDFSGKWSIAGTEFTNDFEAFTYLVDQLAKSYVNKLKSEGKLDA